MNIYSFIIDRFGYEVYLKGRYYPSSFIMPLGMNTLKDRYVHHFRVKDRGGNYHKVMVINNGQKLYDMSCNCGNLYCEHLASVLVQYGNAILNCEIIDELEVSSKILNKYIDNKSNTIKEKLDIELEFAFVDNNIYVRLYIGIGNKKKYVLSTDSKLINFINAFNSENTYEFGKGLTYDKNKYYFDERGKKIIEFLGNYRGNEYYSNNYYAMVLSQREFESLLEIIKGLPFKIKNYGVINAYYYKLPTNYILEEEGDNYLLKLEDINNYIYLTKNMKNVYYNNNLYILSNEDIEYIKLLRESKIKYLTFNKNNLNVFSRGLFNQVKNNLVLDENVKDIELPMSPKTKLYFDITNSKLICDIVFSYKEDVNYFTKNNILRDNEYENKVVSEIEGYGFNIVNKRFILEDIDKMYDFLDNELSNLTKEYEIFTSKRIDNTKILKKLSSNSNFSIGKDNIMSYKFNVDGINTSELDGIFKALKAKKRYYKLKNNNVVSLSDNEEIRELNNLISDLNITSEDVENGNAIIPKYRALYIDSLKNNYKSIKTNNLFDEFIANFKKYKDTCFNFDIDDNSILRDYQKDGVKWLYTIYKCGFGGILADEMGLGKSLQTITLIKQILREKKDAKIIIVVPTSLMYNWQKEFEKFAPSLKFVVVAENKNKRKEILKNRDNYNIFITSYGLIRNDNDEYEKIDFELCVVDEAQNIKNSLAEMTREVKKIKASCKIALTGTPVENNVCELWSIFDFIMPGYLNSIIKFREKYNIKDVDEEGMKILKNLNYQISPFILRRKKKDVIESLPDKIEKNIYIELPDKQKKLYLKVLKDTRKEIDNVIEEEGFAKARMKILQLLMKLRQICIDPKVMYENYDGERIKIEELIKIVKESIMNEHKILIFSSFKRVLDNVKYEFDKIGISNYMIDGSVSSKERMNLVEAFNANDTNCFLITLKSGGTGLNLIGADTVIHLDIWWNPQVENQATDRAHRIGQTKNVSVYKLVTKGTIEERIIELQDKKKILSESLIEGKTGKENISSLTESDIRKLLAYND